MIFATVSSRMTIVTPSSLRNALLAAVNKRTLGVSTLLTLTLALSTGNLTVDAAPPSITTVFVTNAKDSGNGSFRDAITKANSNSSIRRVQFLGVLWTINLTSTIAFSGPQDLTIDGNLSTLDGSGIGSGPAFLVTGGGDLAINLLNVRRAPAEGIDVEVPDSATGVVRVSLFGVSILDNLGHGVLINDQLDPFAPEPPLRPDERGSDAGVDVTVNLSRIAHNGYSVSDRDGLRVNEGGLGNLSLTFKLSVSENNGADGIEVDERGDGDVIVDVFGARLEGNGPFDPADLDDGFDIDELGSGSVLGKVVWTSASNNFEEGLDFNENDAGDLKVDLELVDASGNGEEGIDYEEDDDFAGGGDLIVTMKNIRANGNGISVDAQNVHQGDAGLKIREKGVGIADVEVNGVEASNNFIRGIQVREDDQGTLTAAILKATTLSNASHGIDFDENRLNSSDVGHLAASVTDSTSSNNLGAGVRADQQTATPRGTLLLTNVTMTGNTTPGVAGNNVDATIVP